VFVCVCVYVCVCVIHTDLPALKLHHQELLNCTERGKTITKGRRRAGACNIPPSPHVMKGQQMNSEHIPEEYFPGKGWLERSLSLIGFEF